ncbi:MAG: hypothetical protein CMO80_17130, partial [Verrucomicrobiales bacterium]|nr:hypothetical protein [Verrucomicrobiales bacterium]
MRGAEFLQEWIEATFFQHLDELVIERLPRAFANLIGRNEEFGLLGLSCSQCHGSSDMPHPHWFQSFSV